MTITSGPFICGPLHASIWWDIAMGFSSQQLAGLVSGEQPWSGCPCLSALKKHWLFERIQHASSVLLLAVAVKVLGLALQSPFIVCQQLLLPFQLLLPLLSLAAFLGLVAPAILTGVTQGRDFSTLTLLDELVKKLLLKSGIA